MRKDGRKVADTKNLTFIKKYPEKGGLQFYYKIEIFTLHLKRLIQKPQNNKVG